MNTIRKGIVNIKLIFGICFIAILLFAGFILIPEIFGIFDRYLFLQMNYFLKGNQLAVARKMINIIEFALLMFFLRLLIRRMSKSWPLLEKTPLFSAHVLNTGLPILLGVITLIYFLTWFPHYLFWPWWMDQEHFAISALSWENGIRPYRDLIDFNFPFPIYFNWMVGKMFGWGRPMATNAIDGMVLAGMTIFLCWWSRRKFRHITPGLLGAFFVVFHYCSLDYSRVMQRDWHVVCLAIISICLLQLKPFSYQIPLVALFMAIACNIRPYAVLAMPAIAWAILFNPELTIKIRSQNAIKINLLFFLFTIMLWMPLVMHGMMDDFLRTFIIELKKGGYKTNENTTIPQLLFLQLNRNITFSAFFALIFALFLTRKEKFQLYETTTWLMAFIFFLFYMPLCPVRHVYTEIPFEMVAAVCLGYAGGLILHHSNSYPTFKVCFIVFWALAYFQLWPKYSQFGPTGDALTAIYHWRGLKEPPPGVGNNFGVTAGSAASYDWMDYQNVLRFVRKSTAKSTYVVNFLRAVPFPAINGSTGRLTAYPCAEGIMWLRGVPGSSEADFAKALKKPERCVVVWHDRGERNPIENKFPLIEKTIREHYTPLIRIGDIDIWAKNPR